MLVDWNQMPVAAATCHRFHQRTLFSKRVSQKPLRFELFWSIIGIRHAELPQVRYRSHPGRYTIPIDRLVSQTHMRDTHRQQRSPAQNLQHTRRNIRQPSRVNLLGKPGNSPSSPINLSLRLSLHLREPGHGLHPKQYDTQHPMDHRPASG